MSEPGIFEVMYSLRTMRRLKSDAVPDELIAKVIEAGTQAPSGANTQPWRFLVVRDAETKQFIQQRYHAAILKRFEAFLPFIDNKELAEARNLKAAVYLAEHLHEAPVLLFVCGERDWPASIPEEQRTGKAPAPYGSIYPCVQNVLLACRALGLGASLTTAHATFHDELCERLAIPDDFAAVAMIPIGYPQGKFGPISRQPAAELTYVDRWGQS